jgi:hypothetical protein
MRVLSLDPGTKNFAWSIVEDGEVLETGWVETICSVSQQDAVLFIARFNALVHAKAADQVVLERFTVRPGRAATPAEAINVMIGALLVGCAVPVDVVQASTWKAWVKRHLHPEGSWWVWPDIESQHEADAAGIGVWWSCRDLIFPAKKARSRA